MPTVFSRLDTSLNSLHHLAITDKPMIVPRFSLKTAAARMTRPLCSLLLLLLRAASTTAQTSGSMDGVIADTARQPLERASLRLWQITGRDTTGVAGTAAGAGGTFFLRYLPLGNYFLQVSFQGYKDRWLPVQLTSQRPEITRLRIVLQPVVLTLDSVVVHNTRPIRMHGDTTAYAAEQFHTRPNVTLDGLLKKLPGVDLTSKGIVIALGDTVKRILVNGKPFFANNLQLALQNLPRDLIDQVEVFNGKSDQAKYTGVDDGVRIRTINVILKRSIKAGVYGQVSAAGGVDDHGAGLYSGKLSLNHFAGEHMQSLVGGANNTTPVLGGSTSKESSGVNLSDKWNKTTRFTGSYGQGYTATRTNVNSYIETFVPGDSPINTKEVQAARSTNFTHEAHLSLETDLDSTDHLTFRGDGNSLSTTTITTATSAATKGAEVPLNGSRSYTSTSNTTTFGILNVIWAHRFSRPGRSLSVNVSATNYNLATNGRSQFVNTYFNQGAQDSTGATNQRASTPSQATFAGAGFTYTEPLSDVSNMTIDFHYDADVQNTARSTFAFDTASGKFDRPDSAGINRFRNTHSSERTSVLFGTHGVGWFLSGGCTVQFGESDGRNMSNRSDLRRYYANIFPSATFMKNLNKTSNLFTGYQGEIFQPDLVKMQPVTDNHDPLHVVIGNPNLRQVFEHHLSLQFNHFDPINFSHISGMLEAGLTENAVSSSTVIATATGVDTTRYINVNGTYELTGNIEYGFRLAAPASNLNMALHATDARTPGFLNGVPNRASQYTLAPTVKWTSNFPDHIDINLTETATWTWATYSAESGQNTRYWTNLLDLDGLYYSPSGWQFGSAVQYTSTRDRPAGFNPTTTIWNASVARLFGHRKQLEVKFTVHNMLNQTAGTTQTVSATQIQSSNGSMLGRYYLMGVTYYLKK